MKEDLLRHPNILDSPFLLEVVATSPLHKHDANSFVGVLHFLSLRNERTTDVMMQRFWRALALTLHAAPLQTDDHYLYFAMSSLCSDILWLCRTPETTVSTLNAVLGSFAAPSLDRSIWSMIQRFLSPGSAILLAERLLTALCMCIRRGDIVEHERLFLIDSYFAEMSPDDVVKALTTSLWDARKNAFTGTWDELRAVHLIQHCTELRSEWLLAVLDYARHSQSEGERRMVLALQDELVRRGDCVTCPNELRR